MSDVWGALQANASSEDSSKNQLYNNLLAYDTHEAIGSGAKAWLARGVALEGDDRQLALDEMRRVRRATTRRKRQREAFLGGILTTLVFLLCTFYAFAAVVTLVDLDDGTDSRRDTWSIAQLATNLCCVLLLTPILVWIRFARRPSLASHLILVAAGLISLALLGFATANLVLVRVLQRESSARCAAGLDLVWTLTRSGEICDPSTSASVQSWTLVAVLRIIVTIMLVTVWLYMLRRLVKAMHISLVVDTCGQPTAEFDAIVARNGASLVMVNSNGSSCYEKGIRESQLPPMPEYTKRRPQEKRGWLRGALDWALGRPATDDMEEGPIYCGHFDASMDTHNRSTETETWSAWLASLMPRNR